MFVWILTFGHLTLIWRSQKDIVFNLIYIFNHLQTSLELQNHLQPFLFFNMCETLFASAWIDLLLDIAHNLVLLLTKTVSICNGWWKIFRNICLVIKHCNILSVDWVLYSYSQCCIKKYFSNVELIWAIYAMVC